MSYLNIAIKIKNYEQKFSCKFGLTLSTVNACSGVITQTIEGLLGGSSLSNNKGRHP